MPFRGQRATSGSEVDAASSFCSRKVIGIKRPYVDEQHLCCEYFNIGISRCALQYCCTLRLRCLTASADDKSNGPATDAAVVQMVGIDNPPLQDWRTIRDRAWPF